MLKHRCNEKNDVLRFFFFFGHERQKTVLGHHNMH